MQNFKVSVKSKVTIIAREHFTLFFFYVSEKAKSIGVSANPHSLNLRIVK